MEFIAVAYTLWAIFSFALVFLIGPAFIGKERADKKFTVGWYIFTVIDTGLTAFLLCNAYL